jgi:hypothetical protein
MTQQAANKSGVALARTRKELLDGTFISMRQTIAVALEESNIDAGYRTFISRILLTPGA